MTESALHTLAKGPLIVHLAITHAGSTIMSRIEEDRFKELVREAAGANARKSTVNPIMEHLHHQIGQLADEVAQSSNAGELLKEVGMAMGQYFDPTNLPRYKILLGRFAFAAVRDEAGNPQPERLVAAAEIGKILGYPAYEKFSKRYTDGAEAGAWWPGSDPALQGLSETEINDLARVFAATVSSLLGCHGEEPSVALQSCLKSALLDGYTSVWIGSATGALLRYHDQLFNLLTSEIQGAESSLPIFKQGRRVMVSKLGDREQHLYLQALERLGKTMVGPHSPPSAHGMLEKILSVMNGISEGDNVADSLSEVEEEVLSLGLTAVFFMMASIDGKIDKKECIAFIDLIEKTAKRGENERAAVQAVLRIPQNLDVYLSVINEDRGSTPDFLHAGLALADKRLDETEAQLYRTAVMKIAKDTARAGGKGMFGLGPKIGPKAEQLLNLLSDATGVQWR